MYSSGVCASQALRDWLGARKALRLAADLNCYVFELHLFLGYLVRSGIPTSYALLWSALVQVCYHAHPAALVGNTRPRDVMRGLRLQYRLLVALLYYLLEAWRWLGGMPIQSAVSNSNERNQSVEETPDALLMLLRMLRGVLFAAAAACWTAEFNATTLSLRWRRF